MKSLVLAVYAEGNSDDRFLPPIIQRTAEKLIHQQGLDTVDVLEPTIIPRQTGKREERIFQASRAAYGYHALVVHSDADDRTPERAKKQRIQPGFDRVVQSNASVCRNLVPVIPVQMIEAWMLADYKALCDIIGTDMSAQKLGLPDKIALVEADSTPKNTLNELIRQVNLKRTHRRQRIEFQHRHEALARKIDLNVLNLVPSYTEFVNEMRKALIDLHFIL